MTNREAIEVIKLAQAQVEWEYPMDYAAAFDMAISALEAQEWRPVKKLPKKDGSYLVSGRWGSGKEMVGECEYKVHDGYFSTAWNFDVLAWKPLPEPYREDGNEDR